MKKQQKIILLKSTLIIFLSFLLTSIGHLAWMYRLMTMTTAKTSDLLTVVAGYLLQAFGIGVFAAVQHRKEIAERSLYVAAVIGYAVFLIPAVIGTSLAGVVVFGFLLSLCCGTIAGYYLLYLTKAEEKHRAVSFGVGYGLTTVAAWLLSMLRHEKLYYGGQVILIGISLALLCILSVYIKAEENTDKNEGNQTNIKNAALKKQLLLSVGIIFLMSLVNNIGFSFSTPELQNGMRLEFSRLFYAVGLIAAGFATDKSRKSGAACALAALIIPFIVLALRGETFSSVMFWALGYFAFGFTSVYRIILFSDTAKRYDLLYLAGFGLLTGRIGDAAGSAISFALAGSEVLRVIISAALFAVTVLLFFRLYQLLYIPEAKRHRSEREVFDDFSVKHDLSSREREVLRLMLEDNTNKEISEVLCISENTVKFHMRNLLQKTGCKSRSELRALYHGSR